MLKQLYQLLACPKQASVQADRLEGYGVHSLPKLHSPTYYPIMRYQYYILQHAWSIRLLNVPLCNIHIVLCYMNVPFGYTPFVNLIFY